MKHGTLSEYGWDDRWNERSEELAASISGECQPGRVLAEHGESLRVWVESGEREARVAGALKHTARDRRDLPAVGDWVLVDAVDKASARVRGVLPRASSFVRKAAGQATEPQVVAANVDVVLILSSFGRDINPRRVERYLAITWESGAQPLIVLSKLDLAEDVAEDVARVELVALGVSVVPVSHETGEGLDILEAMLTPGQTVALLGSSGVGKSTLVNCLSQGGTSRIGGIRDADGRGRHTTTHRQMFKTESGLLLIDTPGMRELQPWDGAGTTATFEDLEEMAERCRFRDCTHESEPGCALREAIEGGTLDPARLAGFHKLQREIAHLERQKSQRARAEDKRFTKEIHRALKDHPKYNR